VAAVQNRIATSKQGKCVVIFTLEMTVIKSVNEVNKTCLKRRLNGNLSLRGHSSAPENKVKTKVKLQWDHYNKRKLFNTESGNKSNTLTESSMLLIG
jgi:hypothetical protein